MKITIRNRAGFTLFELMLVLSITGILLSVMLPRAQRAKYEATFSVIRQNASEAGAYTTMWAAAAAPSAMLENRGAATIGDVLAGHAVSREDRTPIPGLLGHYSGNPVFKGVAGQISREYPITNPFNGVSLFDPLNDENKTPADRPGLMYFTAAPARGAKEQGKGPAGARSFYFIFTGKKGRWYGNANPDSPEGIRRGIFVGRFDVQTGSGSNFLE